MDTSQINPRPPIGPVSDPAGSRSFFPSMVPSAAPSDSVPSVSASVSASAVSPVPAPIPRPSHPLAGYTVPSRADSPPPSPQSQSQSQPQSHSNSHSNSHSHSHAVIKGSSTTLVYHPHGIPDHARLAAKHKKEVKRRTKTGCMTCRRRRIKCDETRPVCRNCLKSKRDCHGYDTGFKPQNQVCPVPLQPAANQAPTPVRPAPKHPTAVPASTRPPGPTLIPSVTTVPAPQPTPSAPPNPPPIPSVAAAVVPVRSAVAPALTPATAATPAPVAVVAAAAAATTTTPTAASLPPAARPAPALQPIPALVGLRAAVAPAPAPVPVQAPPGPRSAPTTAPTVMSGTSGTSGTPGTPGPGPTPTLFPTAPTARPTLASPPAPLLAPSPSLAPAPQPPPPALAPASTPTPNSASASLAPAPAPAPASALSLPPPLPPTVVAPPPPQPPTHVLPQSLPANAPALSMDMIYSIGGFPPQPTSSLRYNTDQVYKIHTMFKHLFAAGLDELLETNWFQTDGFDRFTRSPAALSYFGISVESYSAKEYDSDSVSRAIARSTEMKLTWALFCLCRDPVDDHHHRSDRATRGLASSTAVDTHDPRPARPDIRTLYLHEARARLAILECLITGKIASSNPAGTIEYPANLPASKALEIKFWHTVGTFVTYPLGLSAPESDGVVADSLTRARGFTLMNEYREIIYSIMVIRHYGPLLDWDNGIHGHIVPDVPRVPRLPLDSSFYTQMSLPNEVADSIENEDTKRLFLAELHLDYVANGDYLEPYPRPVRRIADMVGRYVIYARGLWREQIGDRWVFSYLLYPDPPPGHHQSSASNHDQDQDIDPDPEAEPEPEGEAEAEAEPEVGIDQSGPDQSSPVFPSAAARPHPQPHQHSVGSSFGVSSPHPTQQHRPILSPRPGHTPTPLRPAAAASEPSVTMTES